MNNSSQLRQETEKLLQCLHDPQARLHNDLDWLLENGSAFPLEEVGSIASLLLKKALEETDDGVREDLLCLVETADNYNPVHPYLDYDGLASLLVSFPLQHGLDYAIMILGSSRQLKHISLLETFLVDESLSIRLMALDAITQIWLEVSDNDPEVKKQINLEVTRHLWFLIGNPKRHTVSAAEMEQLFKAYCDEVMHNLHTWLAIRVRIN